jgi:hypothetical protein
MAGLRPVTGGPPLVPAARTATPGPARAAGRPAAIAPDRLAALPPSDALGRARTHGSPGSAHTPPGDHAPAAGIPLVTTAAARAAIAAGRHQVRLVDGRTLTYPSQRLGAIESLAPDRPGQTHALERHVGTTLADNVARLAASPLLNAAGSYSTLADAQFATDETIANPANQTAIGAFLADPGRLKLALLRVGLGRDVGGTTLRSDVVAGAPKLVPGTTATVVLIKDPTFPEGYRVLTTYPDIREPELDPRGTPLP